LPVVRKDVAAEPDSQGRGLPQAGWLTPNLACASLAAMAGRYQQTRG